MWRKARDIEAANIYGVKNPPTGFVKWAKEQDAVEIEGHTKWYFFKEDKKLEKTQQK